MAETQIDKGPLEIERKFLIRYPDTDLLEQVCSCKAAICQTYLQSEKKLSRRVRKRQCGDKTEYWYTEKVKLSDMTRIEREREITKAEYEEYLKEAIPGAQTISKVRYNLPSGDLCFEIDLFPEWKDRAFAEVELKTEQEDFVIPDCLQVIKEVTNDRRYTNASLAKNGFVYDPIEDTD